MMRYGRLVWSSFLLSCFVKECLSLVCLNCSSQLSSRECTDVTTCAPHEVCFADYLSTTNGIRHVYGCRNAMQCGVALVGKRSNSDCSQCCRSDLCNANLCGETGLPHTLGPVCYACGEQPDSDLCSKVQQCGRDEVCELLPIIAWASHRLIYTTGCQRRTVCESRLNSLNSGNACGTECCDSNLCNKAICDHTNNTDICHPNPCVHGKCYSSPEDYVCICDQSFSGKNCDISTSAVTTITPIQSPCNPNPCSNGQCYNGEMGYMCVCDPTFAGKNCDFAITTLPITTTAMPVDHCHPNPCVHGSCFSSQTDSRCICDPSYTGKSCDTAVIASNTSTQTTVMYCHFSLDLCGWTQSDKDDFDWTRHRGTTSSHGTGPDGDHTDAQGQGYYLYTESSSPRHISDTADLISPELQANTAVCLKMFTNMYGMTVGSIDVLARGNSEPNSNQLIAHFIHATSMPVWVERSVNIPAQPSTFNVIIRGTQGTGFQGDAAIDDIIIYEGQC